MALKPIVIETYSKLWIVGWRLHSFASYSPVFYRCGVEIAKSPCVVFCTSCCAKFKVISLIFHLRQCDIRWARHIIAHVCVTLQLFRSAAARIALLLLHVPTTTTDPILGESLVRMASIPHGITINAQCLALTTTVQDPPAIPSEDPTPIIIATGQKVVPPFVAQNVSNTSTPDCRRT
jgi:hypothetical protein